MYPAHYFSATLHDIEAFEKLIDTLDQQSTTNVNLDPAAFYWTIFHDRMRLITLSRDKHVQISIDIPQSFFSSFQITEDDRVIDRDQYLIFTISLSDLRASLKLISNIHALSKKSSFLCIASLDDCIRMELRGTKDLETLFEFKKLLVQEVNLILPSDILSNDTQLLASWTFQSGIFQDIFQQLYQDMIVNFSSLTFKDPSFDIFWNMTSEPLLEWIIQDSFGTRKFIIEHPTKILLQSFNMSPDRLQIRLGTEWFRFISKTLKLTKNHSATSCSIKYYENGCLSFSLFSSLCKDPVFIQILYASIQNDQNETNDNDYYHE